jgi:predicted NUDIX family NTP pyrophosphohydrolase
VILTMIRKNRRKRAGNSRARGNVAYSGTARKPVVVAQREVSKPIGVRLDTGDFVTLGEFETEPSLGTSLAALSSLDYSKQADFTIARLEREPRELRVGIIGSGELTRDEIIDEVRKGSDIGKQFVQIERAWVERLKDKLSKGEYTLSAQSSATSATAV